MERARTYFLLKKYYKPNGSLIEVLVDYDYEYKHCPCIEPLNFLYEPVYSIQEFYDVNQNIKQYELIEIENDVFKVGEVKDIIDTRNFPVLIERTIKLIFSHTLKS